jgi:hypothetical protein
MQQHDDKSIKTMVTVAFTTAPLVYNTVKALIHATPWQIELACT